MTFLRANITVGYSLNTEVMERRKERKGKLVLNLHPVDAQQSRYPVREEDGPYINIEEATIIRVD